jgi:tellurite resistance protein
VVARRAVRSPPVGAGLTKMSAGPARQGEDRRMIDHHAAIIYTMVLVSAADTDMTDRELQVIGDTVNHLPIFRDYDRKRLTKDLKECAQLLGKEDGLEAALREIKAGLPAKLRETGYVIACDIAAADGETSQEELRLLEILRHRLGIDGLIGAAIERAARARFATA